MASPRLNRLAQEWALRTRGFLGSALSTLARRESRALPSLLEEIGLTGDPTAFFLCKLPRRECYDADLARIAALTKVDPDALAALLARLETAGDAQPAGQSPSRPEALTSDE